MPIDSKKPRLLLVVHGVEVGNSGQQKQNVGLEALIRSRAAGMKLNFTSEMFRYEDLNDGDRSTWVKKVQPVFSGLATAMLSQSPLLGALADKAIGIASDLVQDVVVALNQGTTARKIVDLLKQTIVAHYNQGTALYIAAHSLGSIYAYRAVNELVATAGYFDSQTRRTWPVQGLVTFGSPLPLPMFNTPLVNPISSPAFQRHGLRWRNFNDAADPIISGSYWGNPAVYDGVEKFSGAGWIISDTPVDSGKVWLLAHTAYWQNSLIADSLLDMILN
jgi:hypothetical protein